MKRGEMKGHYRSTDFGLYPSSKPLPKYISEGHIHNLIIVISGLIIIGSIVILLGLL